MRASKFLFIPFVICIAVLGFAQESADDPDAAEPTVVQADTPPSILNNEYFRESVRLNELAKTAFEAGEYDISAAYAQQAAEYARLSDEYVAMRLAQDAFARAHSRYAWAESVGAERRYPSQYRTATAAYNEALAAREAEDWENLSLVSDRVLIALLNVKGPNGETGPNGQPLYYVKGTQTQPGTLPAQYTVRLWKDSGDCFSTIASWAWVYGDAYQWRTLYDANKSKLKDPNNPHLIEPGMVLDIPSLKGETRSGMWDPSVKN